MITSQWPLPTEGIRFVVPEFMSEILRRNSLTKECYPLALGYYPGALGHRMVREQHQDQLVIYCTGGKGYVESEDRLDNIRTGDLIILPKGVAHQYYAANDEPWSIYWVHFSGGLSEDFLTPLLQQRTAHTLIRPRGQAKIINDFETMLEVRQTGYSQNSFIHASNQLRQLLSYLGATSPHSSNTPGTQLDLDAVHALMQEHLHGQLQLDALAAKVNLSKYHFSNKYKTLTGQSPIQHFLHLKMERACYLLDISGHSIKQISANLGYEDSYYFSRLFKKIIGVSPRQYRQLQRG